MANKKILIVDNEKAIFKIIKNDLYNAGFDIETVKDGNYAIQLAQSWKPDLILLDIIMEDMDGIETCRQIRNTTGCFNILVVFITECKEEYIEIAAFEAGGNDYIVVPFKPRAFIRRIRSYFQRYKESTEIKPTFIKIKNLSIDKENHTVYKDSKRIILSRREFNLLFLFCQNPNKVYNRDEILKKVWGDEVRPDSRTVDVHIQRVRRKLGNGYINTMKGLGYKLDI